MLQMIFLLVALATIVLLIQRKRPLYQAMLVGIFILVLSMGKPPAESARLLYRGLTSEVTLELVFAVGLISLLSRMLKDMGFLEQLMESIVHLFRSAKVALVIIPALIGLFPVVGGAIMSAPMVDSLGDRLNLSQTIKSSVNLVFRHAIFYFSPFNPALILMASITGFELIALLKYLFPIGIVNFAVAYFIYLHGKKDAKQDELGSSSGSESGSQRSMWFKQLRTMLYYGAPLLASLGLFIAFGVPLLVSLVIGVVIAYALGDKNDIDLKDLLINGPNPVLMLGIAGIMVFQELVRDLDGAVILIERLAHSGVPLAVLFVLVPLVIGWVSAAFSIAIAIPLPLLFPLVQFQEGAILYAILLYASAFFSYFVSPIHLCQILSNNYFCVNTFDVHRVQYRVLFITFLSGLLLFGVGMLIV